MIDVLNWLVEHPVMGFGLVGMLCVTAMYCSEQLGR